MLALLAEEDARRPLAAAAATAYLADPHVLHWVAEQGDEVVGHLLCYVEPRRCDDELQLLLYEIGVRDGHRRRGIGRLLVETMEAWMREHDVESVWVLADSGDAERFYAACGFAREESQPVQMERLVRSGRA